MCLRHVAHVCVAAQNLCEEMCGEYLCDHDKRVQLRASILPIRVYHNAITNLLFIFNENINHSTEDVTRYFGEDVTILYFFRSRDG